jgi:DNA invertase Pin-like site-specific DNA recombinase
LRAIKAYAAAHDFRIVQAFEERGVSGKTDLENRPALMSMLEALAANGTRLVLIEKLDRLVRDLMVQETITGDFRKRGFQLVSVMEPDLLEDDPARKLMRQIFGAIAEYEKAMIVAKLRGARQRTKAKEGRCEGRKPYGFYEGEAAILDRMRRMRADGATYAAIADTLNREGIAPRDADAKWHPGYVHRILSR